MIARKPIRQQLHDDDKQLLIEEEPIFYSLPEPPAAWNDLTQPLSFQLEASEANFLRNCFLSVARPGSDGSQSLLARIVDQRVAITGNMELWSAKLRVAADQSDREALLRARQASALSAIGRGVYAALVEQSRDEYDAVPTEDVHRTRLVDIVEEYAPTALALKVDDIRIDAPSIPSGILEILRATQWWLRSGTRSIAQMYETYERAESKRKGRRARLSKTLPGRERRAEWVPDQHPPAKPLHYRWEKVRQLIMDLQGV